MLSFQGEIFIKVVMITQQLSTWICLRWFFTFYFLPWEITIKPPFGRLYFTFSKHTANRLSLTVTKKWVKRAWNFFMDGNGETTVFHVLIQSHPIETTVYKWMFEVPGIYLRGQNHVQNSSCLMLFGWNILTWRILKIKKPSREGRLMPGTLENHELKWHVSIGRSFTNHFLGKMGGNHLTSIHWKNGWYQLGIIS